MIYTYVRQMNAYKIIKNINRTEKGNLPFNPITEHTWLGYYYKIWTKQFNDNATEGKCAKLTENCVDLITMEELETTIKTLKSRKSPGSDRINNELYKHTPKFFFTKVFELSKCLLDLRRHSQRMEGSRCYTNT